MPNKVRKKWQRPFRWPPSTWEFTPGLQVASDVLTCLVFMALLATVVGALIAWPMLIYRTAIVISSGTPDDLRNILLAVAALVGVPFLIWRTLIAAKQTEISRESHYTDLFTKAVEQLGAEKTVKRRDFHQNFQLEEGSQKVMRDRQGKPIPATSPDGEPLGQYESYEVTDINYEVRLGAIYALERIAQDSSRDSQPIYLTLCAYLQNNAPPAVTALTEMPTRKNNSDIEEILNVMNRYSHNNEDIPGYQFDGIHIPNINFFNLSFKHITFDKCSQAQAEFSCNIDDLNYKNSLIGRIVYKYSSVNYSGVVGGKLDNLFISNSEIEHCLFLSNILSITVVSSNVSQSSLQFGRNSTNIDKSIFRNTMMYETSISAYAPRNAWRLDDNEFVDCSFYDCDFSFRDWSSNTFTRCEFYNCNMLKQAGIQEAGGNIFNNCFTEELIENDDPIDKFRATSLWQSRPRAGPFN
ncbi:UNVERIFIED_ORG: uncharacterized protein YjbI with pentapeptide repeats [Rhizobium sophorae]|uniref:hypothetical protein n=1 Tax=Rhizobium leguminosarum TaxID=384 RepID=UPI001611EA83|nr:hypothetical protein [Rhizobium leguminosarum]MBB4520536.1 uncharacterized protein YjbI with pentapeptide repeats [Rhizobium leguminosarum]MDH6658417.1 uncharacterized protein YjbI with pentapeptide repeats [Rhizobium sophorae]